MYGGSATGINFLFIFFFLLFGDNVLTRWTIDASRAVGDYSYVLNTTSYEWTAINTVNDGAGPRFGHSGM